MGQNEAKTVQVEAQMSQFKAQMGQVEIQTGKLDAFKSRNIPKNILTLVMPRGTLVPLA